MIADRFCVLEVWQHVYRIILVSTKFACVMNITSKFGFSLSLKYIENNAYGSNPKSCLSLLDTNRYNHHQISTSFIL